MAAGRYVKLRYWGGFELATGSIVIINIEPNALQHV